MNRPYSNENSLLRATGERLCRASKLFSSLAGFVLLATSLASSTSAQDQVVLLRGTPVSGTITSVSPTEVSVEVRGRQRKVAVNEIRRVSFREDPPELKRARDKILIGRFDSGLDDLKKVSADDITRPEVKQDLEFYRALCRARLSLTEGGDKSAAAGALLDFAKRNPNSFHFLEAAETLGDLAVGQDDYDDAVRYYKAMGAKAPWPDFKVRAALLEGRARLAQGSFAAARDLFDSVDQYDVDTPEVTRQKQFAVIGKAICLAEEGATDEAQQELRSLISSADPQDTELFGRAYNGLGRCHLKAEQPTDALLAFLHVDILFPGDPESHAESLYHLSHLWNTVNRADRAAAVRRLLDEKYSGSKWSKRE